jgi:hypothetical protein
MAFTKLSSRQSYTELRLPLRSATTAKTLVMCRSTASNPLDVCAVVATYLGNAPKRQMQNPCRAAAIAP